MKNTGHVQKQVDEILKGYGYSENTDGTVIILRNDKEVCRFNPDDETIEIDFNSTTTLIQLTALVEYLTKTDFD